MPSVVEWAAERASHPQCVELFKSTSAELSGKFGDAFACRRALRTCGDCELEACKHCESTRWASGRSRGV